MWRESCGYPCQTDRYMSGLFIFNSVFESCKTRGQYHLHQLHLCADVPYFLPLLWLNLHHCLPVGSTQYTHESEPPFSIVSPTAWGNRSLQRHWIFEGLYCKRAHCEVLGGVAGPSHMHSMVESGAEVTSIFLWLLPFFCGRSMRGGHSIVTSTQYSYGFYPKNVVQRKLVSAYSHVK